MVESDIDTAHRNQPFMWSSAGMVPTEAFSRFREELGGRMPEIQPELSRERRDGFSARLTVAQVAGGTVTALMSTPHLVQRGPAQIRSAERELVVLGLQVSGDCTLSSAAGGTRRLASGDLFVTDGRRPFDIDHRPSRRMEVISMAVPAEVVGNLVLDKHGGIVCLSDAPMLGPLARDAFNALGADATRGSGLAAATLRNVTLDLVSAILSGGVGAGPVLSGDVARRAMRQHLTQPGFDVADCARLLGMTVRSLQRCFAAEGTTFGRELLEQRLSWVESRLSDPAHAHVTIGALAYAAGFTDLSHFNHAFRSRRDCTPTEFRLKARETEGARPGSSA